METARQLVMVLHNMIPAFVGQPDAHAVDGMGNIHYPLPHTKFRWRLGSHIIASSIARRIRSGQSAGAEPAWSLREFFRAPTSCILLPALEASGNPDFRIHTQFDLARTGVAVERFRLAQGRLLQHLGELVPAFLDGVPRDPWNEGRPVSYRIKDNGEFVVYSFGYDLKDDHGEDGQNWMEGDLNFTVAPPEVRDWPQVAPEAAQGAEQGVS